MTTTEIADSKYPSTDLAYAFVQQSYAWMLGRLDSAESRIQQLQAFAATLTFAAPVFIRSLRPQISTTSGWFYAALILFAVILAVGVFARLSGVVKLPSLERVRTGWLHLPEERFKQDAIFFAAQHFTHNRRMVNRKGNAAIIMTVGFGLEIGCFVAWWLIR